MSLNDGSASAPAGTPQDSTLLNGYAVRPSWQVAGVDYAVGVPAGTQLKDPSTISLPGVSVNATSHTIAITGSNVTLSGYDFALNGGWGITITGGAANTTIENSNFLIGANNKIPIYGNSSTSNLKVLYNTLDGGGTRNNGNANEAYALIYFTGSGSFTAQYNAFQNAADDAIDLTGQSTPTTPMVAYNLFQNLGTSAGSHPDTVQFTGGKFQNSTIAYNTVYQPVGGGEVSGEEGIQVAAQLNSSITDTTVSNNTVIAKGPSLGMSYSIAIQQASGATNVNNGGTVAQNFIDVAGAYGAFYPISSGNPATNWSFSNNVDLVTGSIINANNSESAAPSGPTTSPPSVTQVTASPSTGTEFPGDTVALTLQFSQPVVVSGSPTLRLNDGGTASYAGGSGSNSLNFAYKVSSADTTVANLAITQATLPPGSSITSTTGAAASLTGAVATFPGLAIDPPTPGLDDGSGQGAGGAAQLPNLLANYLSRPAWQVAGVDYSVGVHSGTALKDPTLAANVPAGVSINSVNHLININSSNVTLNGFDFSLHGGWGINIAAGVKGTTIENCNFSMGASEPIAINAQSTSIGDLSVLYCTFNGNKQNIPSVQPPPAGSGLGAAINYNGTGNFVGEYNNIYNMPGDGIDFSVGTVTPTIKYNVFNGLGYTTGAHPDPIQFNGDVVNNATIAFNTIYSPQDQPSANEGLAIEAQSGSTISSTRIENNVIIATGPQMTQSLNIGLFQDSGGNSLNGVIVSNNYLDPTATFTPTGFGDTASEVQGSNLTIANNVNMVTGANTQPSAGVFRTSDVTAVTASPGSGTETTREPHNFDRQDGRTGHSYGRPDPNAERWRHRALCRRIRDQCTDLQLHGSGH